MVGPAYRRMEEQADAARRRIDRREKDYREARLSPARNMRPERRKLRLQALDRRPAPLSGDVAAFNTSDRSRLCRIGCVRDFRKVIADDVPTIRRQRHDSYFPAGQVLLVFQRPIACDRHVETNGVQHRAVFISAESAINSGCRFMPNMAAKPVGNIFVQQNRQGVNCLL